MAYAAGQQLFCMPKIAALKCTNDALDPVAYI